MSALISQDAERNGQRNLDNDEGELDDETGQEDTMLGAVENP